MLRLILSHQVLVLVGLDEVAGQILNHHIITRSTIRLGGLYFYPSRRSKRAPDEYEVR
jgi:hypothetical protein